jgi:hypothetical protein
MSAAVHPFTGRPIPDLPLASPIPTPLPIIEESRRFAEERAAALKAQQLEQLRAAAEQRLRGVYDIAAAAFGQRCNAAHARISALGRAAAPAASEAWLRAERDRLTRDAREF